MANSLFMSCFASTLFLIYVNAEVFYNCKKPGKAALTFDDGPHREYTALVLDVLKAANVKATFFLTGINGFESNETRYRATVKRMYDEGHQIGSHTWNHPTLTELPEAEIRNELAQVADLIYDILNVNMSVVRPPHGFYNDQVLRVIDEFNYDTIMWNVDTEDWLYLEDTSTSIQAWIDAINSSNGRDGSYIGLHHDPMSGFTNLTQWVVDVVSAANLTMTTIADCIEKPMYYL